MQFEGAKVTEQGVTFGILVVKPNVLQNATEQARARQLGTHAFGAIPIVLMAQDNHGVPTYQGRPDIVRFLSNLYIKQIPWRNYTLSAV